MISLAVLSILIISLPSFCFGREKYVRYDIPRACCSSYNRRQIPFSHVEDFYETSSSCSKPGIIFLTKKGVQICANPRNVWVQRYISKLEQKKTTEEHLSKIDYFYEAVELSPSEK